MADENKEPTVENQETTPEDGEQKTTAAGQDIKTFTQADVDKIISDRLKRERDKLPSDDKLKAFKEWEKAQQTEAEKAAEREKELAKAQADAENLRRENAVIKAGVAADDADYVIFKVGKMEGEFDKNLKSFLAENKKYAEGKTVQVDGTRHDPSKSETQEEKNLKAFYKGAGIEKQGDK